MIKPLLPIRVRHRESRLPSLSQASYRGIRIGDTVQTLAIGGAKGVVDRLVRDRTNGQVMAWLRGAAEPIEARTLRRVS